MQNREMQYSFLLHVQVGECLRIMKNVEISLKSL